MNYIKKTIRTRSSTSSVQSLEVPTQRGRILSDSAALLSKKKNGIAENWSKVNKSSTTARPPLSDLNKNIKRNPTAPAKVIVKNNLRFSDTFTAKKSQKASKSHRLSDISHESKPPAGQSKYNHIANLRNSLPAAHNGTASNEETDSVFKKPAAKETFTVNIKSNNTHRKLSQTLVVDDYDADLNKIFAKSALHYISFKAPETPSEELVKETVCVRSFIGGKFTSPIKPNAHTAKLSILLQVIPDLVGRTIKQNTHTFYEDFYVGDYLEDIVQYQLRNDQKFIVKKYLLKIYNPCLRTRAAVVNWLIQIQDYLNQSPAILFTTICMFDKVLGSTPVPINMYQLVGLVIMWIVSKFKDAVNTLTAPKMVALCEDTYSLQQFLRMERKLLVFFGFDLNISDVTLFVTFYIRKLNIKSDLLLSSIYYILECYTLSINFSTVTPSMQAAAAVCLGLSIYHSFESGWHTLKHVVGYYGKKQLEGTMQDMAVCIRKVQNPNYLYRHTYHKYATKENIQASIVLHQLIEG